MWESSLRDFYMPTLNQHAHRGLSISELDPQVRAAVGNVTRIDFADTPTSSHRVGQQLHISFQRKERKMPDVNPVVKQAIEESVEAFVRGVHCANPANPDVTIPDGVVEWLKNDKNLIQTFTELLNAKPGRWDDEGPIVCRSAFHAGSLAALHAYASDGPKVVDAHHVIVALQHVSEICAARVGVRWKWCRRLPERVAAGQ